MKPKQQYSPRHLSQEFPSTKQRFIAWLKKAKQKTEDYLGDCAMFTTAVPTTAPLEALNGFLNGVGTLSAADMKRTAGSACQVAQAVCRPMTAGMYTRTPTALEAEKYAAMLKAFSDVTDGNRTTW